MVFALPQARCHLEASGSTRKTTGMGNLLDLGGSVFGFGSQAWGGWMFLPSDKQLWWNSDGDL